MEVLDGSGRTAVEWAKERGEREVVRALKKKRMIRGGEGGEKVCDFAAHKISKP